MRLGCEFTSMPNLKADIFINQLHDLVSRKNNVRDVKMLP